MAEDLNTSVTDVAPERDTSRDAAVLDALGASLSAKRQKAVDARQSAGIDQRWFEDVEAYEGRDEVTRNYAGLRAAVQGYINQTDQGYINQTDQQTKKRSTLVVNVTRQKVNTASARRADIALPTDDRNWDLRPSTVPELVEQMTQKHVGLTKNGSPVMVTENGQQRQANMSDFARMTMDEATKRAKAMRDEIDDQLDMSDRGCGWEGLVRKLIDDNALLGVGVFKGPVLSSRGKKVWIPVSDGQTTVHQLSRIQTKKPTSSCPDPWDVYPHPDCGENPKQGGIWERSKITAADIRHMADLEGYLIPQLTKVLREGPKKVSEQTQKPGTETVVDAETLFEQWEYHGELDREELLAAGVELSEDDVFKAYSGVVILINDTVVKADIEILDTEELPYDFYVVNKCSGSWCGYSESFLARSAQKAITAGWRAMMDNAGQIVGGQIVMDRKQIEPADGKWELSGMKVWLYKGDGDSRHAFAVHEIPAHQEEYAAIIKMGMEFLDQETAVPMLAQGEQGTATDVLGGMNLLLQASNVVQRRALKALDDQVTIPHIGRYIDWNMQYNPKAEIKGDFEVQARASGALLEQAEQNKGAANLVALAANPAYAHGMKKWDALRRVIKALRFDPKEFVKTDDEIAVAEEKLAQQPPQDPRIAVEQIRAELAKLRMDFEGKEGELERRNKLVIAAIDERMNSTQLTSEERQNLDKIKATLTSDVLKLNTQKDLSLANLQLDLHKHRNPAPQIMKPPTEPAGRARPGRAFQA